MWKLKFDECNDTKQRNRLPLSDRIKAIEAYKQTPNYTKVGRMFNCSAKQIRTIVSNKEKILAISSIVPVPNIKTDKVKASLERRAKKVALLGRVMYEWFLRARRNPTVCLISYKLIQEVALEVKKVLNVDNFYPNNAWLLNFRQKYGITDFDMKVQHDDPGPSELDVESIVGDVVEREKHNSNSVAWSDGPLVYNDDSSASNNTQHMSLSATGSRSRASDSLTDAESDDEPLSKYPKLEPIDVIEIESEEDDDDDNDTANTTSKFSIKNIDEALEHLKPLEDFALMNEDYRVIGLISQLEVILKKSKNK